MYRNWFILSIVILFCCTLGNRIAGGSSDTETGTITGCVINRDLTAAGGALVGIKAVSLTDSPSIVTFFPAQSQMTADSNGRFTFSSLPAGSYAVAAKYQDSLGGIVRVGVVARDTAHATIVLAPVIINPILSHLAWSIATYEIVFDSWSYTIGHLPCLKAINITNNAIRVIDTTGRFYGSLFVSKNGTMLYYAAVSDTQGLARNSIYSVPLNGSEPPSLVDSGLVYNCFAFLPDSCWIAYRKLNSIIVLDASNGTQRFTAGFPSWPFDYTAPYDFASDGTKLICTHGKYDGIECGITDSTYIYNLISPLIDTVVLHVRMQNTYYDTMGPVLLRLDPDGLKCGYTVFTKRFFVTNITTADTVQLFAGSCSNSTWTPDGKSVTLWTGTGFTSPYTLHLINVTSAADRIICRGNPYNSLIAFSPSGTGIAYIGDSAGMPRMYISDTRWQE
jgi:hypothetical protein